MSENAKYQVEAVTSDSLRNALYGASPLQASKILMNVELSDQKDSLAVLQQVEQEFAQQPQGISGALVEPILLNICDGIAQHPKWKLADKGLTASKIYHGIKHFSYDQPSEFVADNNVTQRELQDQSKRTVDDKGSYDRKQLEDKKQLNAYRDKTLDGNRRITSEIDINDQGGNVYLYRQSDKVNVVKREQGKKSTSSSIDIDHQVPLKKIFTEYGASQALSLEDLKSVANSEANFKAISAKLNRSKGDKSWQQYQMDIETKRSKLLAVKAKNGSLTSTQQNQLNELPNKATLERALQAEIDSKRSIEKQLNKTVTQKLLSNRELHNNLNDAATQSALNIVQTQGLGELILLVTTPVFYELNNIFQYGLIGDTGETSKTQALLFRFKRVQDYILTEVERSSFDFAKNALMSFAKCYVQAVIDLFVGIWKQALKVVTEGFSATIQAFKIVLGSGTKAQKHDAITKLFATTAASYASIALQTAIDPFVKTIPVIGDTLSSICGLLLSTISSCVVVWLLEQLDLFSLKAERRTQRVQEVFALRIEQIKCNTDVFEKESVAKLAQDRMAFLKFSETMQQAIENNENVNDSVTSIAQFMGVQLELKDSDDFLTLLEREKYLVI